MQRRETGLYGDAWECETCGMTVISPPPAVSVIVAVYNVRDHIAEAIASLQSQSFADFEALVIDDGSRDGSGEIAAQAWGDDPRFRLIQQRNMGLSGARNTGLALARGQFLTFLDGDDTLAPAFLGALHAAIEREGTAWAACGVDLTYPDGAVVPHTALHGAEAWGADRSLDLSDACAAVQVFPSAWNKLFRRAAWGALRFPEGSWYEDHEVYWAFAAAHPRLAYVARPLYRHRRDRDGQITGTDSDRVFEQFAVLERLRPLVLGGGFDNAATGFARLATRLVHERALVVKDRARRRRFLAAITTHFKAWGIAYTPHGDLTISRGLGLALAGKTPVSVIVVADPAQPDALARGLQALEQQSMADFQLLVLAPPDVAVPAHLACGQPVERVDLAQIDALQGRLMGAAVVIYAPGEQPVPDGLMWLVNTLEDSGAALAFAALDRDRGGFHDGWVDNRVAGCDLAELPFLGALIPMGAQQALRLYPMLGNRIMRPDLLRSIPALAGKNMDLCAVQGAVLFSALATDRVGYTRLPVATLAQAPTGTATPLTCAIWARALPARHDADLPAGWRGTLFLRMVRAQLGGKAGRLAWLWVVCVAWLMGFGRAERGVDPDHEYPRWVYRALRHR
ncbi:glycosyltransferase family 2 protein [Pararhodobacter sp.]|uniref:glycosyltransferase family 2 protein n=1 Tax=Pararhodobacter sp. TaxID=2127056 RepID=UPI002AFE6DE9|nr:glycosyltransferase family 2 protein [Pararhodobacter sp.]